MPDLDEWINNMLDNGYSPDEILQSLLKAGYSEDQARSAIQNVLKQRKSIKKSSSESSQSLSETITQYKPLIYLLVLLVVILLFTGGYLYANYSKDNKVVSYTASSPALKYYQINELPTDVREFITYYLDYFSCYPEKFYRDNDFICFNCSDIVCFENKTAYISQPFIKSNKINEKIINLLYKGICYRYPCKDVNSTAVKVDDIMLFELKNKNNENHKISTKNIEIIPLNNYNYTYIENVLCNYLESEECKYVSKNCICGPREIFVSDGSIKIL